MARSTKQSIANVDTLSASFGRHLRAGNRSPRTIRSYLDTVGGFDAFLASRGMPRDAVDAITPRAHRDLHRGPARPLQGDHRGCAVQVAAAVLPLGRR